MSNHRGSTVVDSQGNVLSVTSYQYTDEEIVQSLLQKLDETICIDEERLDTFGGNLEENVSENTGPQQDFSSVLDSLSNVIEYIRDDPQELAQLVSLRNKLIENEWKKKRNM